MKRFIPKLPMLLLVTALAGCSTTSEEINNGDKQNDPGTVKITTEYDRELTSLVDTATAPDLSANFESFARELFAEVRKGRTDENLMISPFSISTALSMTVNGAADPTMTEMLDAMSLENVTLKETNSYNSVIAHELTGNSDITFNNANSIWLTERYTPLKRSFYEVITDYYLADIFPLTGVDPVNSWISDQTNGKIPKMLNDLPEDVALLLVNAVYFLGNWETQFDTIDTRDEQFTLTSGETVTVDMMNMTENLSYKKGKEFTAVSLPYKDGETSLYLFIPDSGVTLNQFMEGSFANGTGGGYFNGSMNYEKFEMEWTWQDDSEEKLFSHFQTGEVSVKLPKFKFSSDAPLKATLTNIGMGSIFENSANFPHFAENQNPVVGDVLHKSFIEVNETGTEAAAATVVVIVDSAVMLPVKAHADRPFFFCIRNDETGTILFEGQVSNPGE